MPKVQREMLIYVVTRGRPQREHQHTLNNLPLIWRSHTTVVCPTQESAFFENTYNVPTETPKTKNITEKRKWIFENTVAEKILMLDDDLRFHVRREPNKNTKLSLPSGPNDAKLVRMFDALEKKLDTRRHVGISGRFMNNTVTEEWKYTTKTLHALGWHVPTVIKHCELDRIMCGVEHDLTLQLFEAGFPNAVYYWGTQEEPSGRAAPGGTSFYRTNKMIMESAKKMEKLHPGIVKIADDTVQPPKVRIAWRKALAK